MPAVSVFYVSFGLSAQLLRAYKLSSSQEKLFPCTYTKLCTQFQTGPSKALNAYPRGGTDRLCPQDMAGLSKSLGGGGN